MPVLPLTLHPIAIVEDKHNFQLASDGTIMVIILDFATQK